MGGQGDRLSAEAGAGERAYEVPADRYERFMGRYSRPLAPAFADVAGIAPGARVLDVGAGSGALTDELVARCREGAVAAAEPSAQLEQDLRRRLAGCDVRRAGMEALPFADGAFDAAVAQLVVQFVADPVAGMREMARVARRGGTVAACVWDHAGRRGPLATFWAATRSLDPGLPDGGDDPPGTRRGDLARFMRAAGLREVVESELTVHVAHPDFEDWWAPYGFGAGPAGAYVAGLDDTRRDALREACRRLLPDPPFTVTATAWAARGTA